MTTDAISPDLKAVLRGSKLSRPGYLARAPHAGASAEDAAARSLLLILSDEGRAARQPRRHAAGAEGPLGPDHGLGSLGQVPQR